MNKQAKKGGRGIEWTDYTWNPISGCFHACQWQMPDGAIANCYAEDVATRVAQAAYPQGFEHHYWKPQLLAQPLGVAQPSRIFVGSMADVFGHWVADDHINAVLDVCRRAHWHTFQFLTKNPVRVKNFDLPPNVWIGASSPPDFMWNKRLSSAQQAALFERTFESLKVTKANVRWISFEPLSNDWAWLVEYYADFIEWAVIGAASNGRNLYPPEERHVRDLIGVLDDYEIPVFFKGNMRSLDWARDHWREDFPQAEALQP
jgi:protein gp37